jgi:hypothetical protein
VDISVNASWLCVQADFGAKQLSTSTEIEKKYKVPGLYFTTPDTKPLLGAALFIRN